MYFTGRVAEWFKALVLKTKVFFKYREFESQKVQTHH